MTVRPTTWQPLSDTDLLPGDSDLVRWLAAHFDQISTEIRTAATDIDAATTDPSNTTQAMLALRERACSMATDLRHAAARYQHTSHALAQFAITVDSFQSIGLGMLHKAQQLLQDQQSIEHAMLLAAADTDSSDAATRELGHTRYDRLQEQHAELTQKLRDLRHRYEQVASDYAVAATAVAHNITQALADNPLADNWYQVHAEGIVDATTDVTQKLGLIVGAIGLGLAVTGVGAPLGFVLLGSGIALTALVTKSVDYTWGTGTSKADVAGAVIDVSLCGAGHTVSWLAKGSASSMHWAMSARKSNGPFRMRGTGENPTFSMDTKKRSDWRTFRTHLTGKPAPPPPVLTRLDNASFRYSMHKNGFNTVGAVDNNSLIRAGMTRNTRLRQTETVIETIQNAQDAENIASETYHHLVSSPNILKEKPTSWDVRTKITNHQLS